MVIVKLFICRRTVNADPIDPFPLQNTHSLPVYDGFQSHLLKIFHRRPDDPLKTEMVTDIHGLFLRQILPAQHKSDPVAFRISIRDQLYLLLRQSPQIIRHSFFLLRHIFTVSVQETIIRQIRLHHDLCTEILRRVHLSPDPPLRNNLGVIADIPI